MLPFIDQSPLCLDIVERDCMATVGNNWKVVNSVGDCVCRYWKSLVWTNCIPMAILIPLLLGGALMVRRYLEQKRLEAQFWLIAPQKIYLPDKAQVLGHGRSGLCSKHRIEERQ